MFVTVSACIYTLALGRRASRSSLQRVSNLRPGKTYGGAGKNLGKCDEVTCIEQELKLCAGGEIRRAGSLESSMGRDQRDHVRL